MQMLTGKISSENKKLEIKLLKFKNKHEKLT